ncbi:helix-turn-helix domain-containing protein [Clostridium sardiniense]|uniref:winged helix-turn-helix transcriptional regulator n=1 Tax=Clostridium sardiniense TaxID=29369 RepID=UPI001956354D|nr:helix-turn-helix domain-containing protein [Clostridium sardiniense]MBM7834846.1 DNA-binding HxlR family transcriptional regulator [Clostridium sardiniense]
MSDCNIKNYSEREFAIKYALNILNGKWKLQIMWEISKLGTIRFNELQRNLDGISSIMLSRSLTELGEHNLVSRKQYNEIPPRVEYTLTDLGKSLCPVLHALEDWGYKVFKESNNINDK